MKDQKSTVCIDFNVCSHILNKGEIYMIYLSYRLSFFVQKRYFSFNFSLLSHYRAIKIQLSKYTEGGFCDEKFSNPSCLNV